MILYRFCSTAMLETYENWGQIPTTDSRLGSHRRDFPPMGPDVGPRVVWLTSEHAPTPAALGVDEAAAAIRIAVDLDLFSSCRWLDWQPRRRAHPRWLELLEAGADPSIWYVAGAAIPVQDWLGVDHAPFHVSRWVGQDEQ